jgi:hypothetical protein
MLVSDSRRLFDILTSDGMVSAVHHGLVSLDDQLFMLRLSREMDEQDSLRELETEA